MLKPSPWGLLGPMGGPFDGVLVSGEGSARESLSAAYAEALAAVQQRAWPLADDIGPPGDAARPVLFTFDADGVAYAADIATLKPWTAEALRGTRTLDALARVGRCLAHLHGRGVVHGDLRPEMLRVDDAGAVTLLVPARSANAGALLAARVHAGAAPATAVGYAAPEVAAAFEATPASDVYGLAAIAYATLTGYSPLGQVNLPVAEVGPHGDLARLTQRALNLSPGSRPTLDVFVDALARASTVAPAPNATPYRGGLSSGAEAAAVRRDVTELSPLLVLVLVVGGLCAFFGAVLLVSAGWDVVGSAGRVAILGLLAGASWGLGALAARRGLDTAATVGRGMCALFGSVALAYTFYLLHDGGRLALLVALDFAAFAGSQLAARRGAPLGSAALLVLGTQLLWTVGAQWVALTHAPDGAGTVASIAAGVAAVTFGIAVARRSLGLGIVAALDAAVFAAAFGEFLRSGAVLGPPSYALCVAVAYALLAVAATWTSAESAAQPMAVGALIAAVGSAFLGIEVMNAHWDTHALPASLWPYGVVLLCAAATRARAPLGTMAGIAVAFLASVVPSAEALTHDAVAFAAVAVAAGAGIVFAATFAPPLRTGDDARTEALLAGLFGMMAAPDLRVLHAIDTSGRADGAAAAWALLALSSVSMVVLSYASTGRVSRARYRMLEVAALVQGFGLVLLHTVAAPSALGFAVASVALPALGLALGASTRRAAVLVLSAAALVAALAVQYFLRLSGVFPLALRLVGFGVALLVGGVLYEQQVRRRLTLLRDWS